jgi:hypothetical protein
MSVSKGATGPSTTGGGPGMFVALLNTDSTPEGTYEDRVDAAAVGLTFVDGGSGIY